MDVFFVLSGFLITSILAAEFGKTGNISLTSFYRNRLLRLTPALFTMVLFFTALRSVLFPEQWSGFIWRETLPSLLYISNFTKIFTHHPQILGHTWSLAIEEQFYLLWPLALLLALPSGPRFTLWLSLGIAAASATWRTLLIVDGVPMQYWPAQGFETHLDGLLIGAALALSSARIMNAASKAWIAAIIVILTAALTVNASVLSIFYGGRVIVEICAAIIIAKIVADQKCMLVRVLDWWPLASLGLVSYAFYLWHGPILGVLIGTSHLAGWKLALVGFPLSILASWISWVVIERPIHNARRRSGAQSALSFPNSAATSQ